MASTLATVWMFILFMTAYFMPTIIGEIRGNKNLLSLFVMNAITGWTFVGWILSFLLACKPLRK